MKHFDLAIIGRDLSVTSSAFYSGNQGISTVIIEKENLPRFKTCVGGFVFRANKESVLFQKCS